MEETKKSSKYDVNSLEESSRDVDNIGFVVKNIYMSCDPENTDSVPVSKLIEFVKPYLLEELEALDYLKNILDPENTNKCISSAIFYESMNKWSQKVSICSDTNENFDIPTNQLDNLDVLKLPYVQSTPRQSFGQKLASCKDLMNISNASTYSISNLGDNATLEEDIRKLEYQLTRITDELAITKLQLSSAEDQNDTLMADLERINKRLQAEAHVNELLQRDKSYTDDLKDELNSYKKKIEDLNRKIVLQEKECECMKELLKQTETEKCATEKKCELLLRNEQQLKMEIIDIRSVLNDKEEEINVLLEKNEEMKSKLREHKDLLDQFINEKEILIHEKETMEKSLKDKICERKKSILLQFKNELNESMPTTKLGDSPSQTILLQLLKQRHSLSNTNTENTENTDSPKNVDMSCDQSSEEDIFWKYKEQLPPIIDTDHESLHAEICKAESLSSSNYSLLLFEKEEKMLELEEQHQNCKKIINDLNVKIDFLTEENKSLVDNLEKLKKENSENHDKLRDDLLNTLSKNIINTTAEIEKHLEIKNDTIRELVNINKTLENQANIFENELRQRYSEVHETKLQIQNYIETQNGLWRNLQCMRIQCENLKKENCDINEKIEKIYEEKEKLYLEIVDKNSVIDSLKNDIKKYENKMKEIEKDEMTLERASKASLRNKNVKKIDKEQLTISKLREKIEFLENKLELEKRTKNNEITVIKSLEKQIDTLKNEHKQKGNVIQQNLLELREKEEHIKELLKQIEDTKTKLINSENEKIYLQKDTQTFQLKIQKLEEQIKIYRENQSDDFKQRQLCTLENKIKSAKSTLESTEYEITLNKNNIQESKVELIKISDEISKISRVLKSGIDSLKQINTQVFDICKNIVEIKEDKNIMNIFKEIEDIQKISHDIENSVDNDLDIFMKQLKIVLLLFEYVANKSAKQMETVTSTDYLTGDGKTLNRFTLRSPKLNLNRPISPDSPCVEFETYTLRNIENNAKTDPKLFDFEFAVMSDEIVQKLNAEEAPVDEIVKNLSINSKDISLKLTKHKEKCLEEYENYLALLRDISNRLRDHICIGTSEPIAPVFVLIEELRGKILELLNIIGQCGVLTYESRMTNCWNLLANYLEMLKNENENLKQKDKSYFGFSLRNRLKNVENNKETSPDSSNTGSNYTICFPKITTSKIIILLTIFILGAFIFTHVNCRINNSQSTLCPLDIFITTKNTGIPPF